MMSNLDLSIIIVSFNTKEMTVECVKSINRTVKRAKYEIIVVDNASNDGSVAALEELKTQDLRLKTIANKQNLGFSAANNVGVKESVGRHVLFLNSDTVVYEKTIDGMVDFMDNNPQAGASTCFLRLPNGKLDDATHRGFPTPLRSLSHFSGVSKLVPIKPFTGYTLKHLGHTTTHEIDALAGAFMLVRREAGEAVGWWDEDFFFYGEDLDFCYRLKEVGWKIYFVPEFEILHYKGVSAGMKKHSQHISRATDETRRRAIDERFRAMKLFYDKHYKNRYPKAVRYLVLGGINIKKLLTK